MFSRVCSGLYNQVVEHNERRKDALVPIFKNDDDAQGCSNDRGIKLIGQKMKVWGGRSVCVCGGVVKV